MGMNGIGSLMPAMGGQNPMQMMAMLSQMAQKDPDGLAKMLASQGATPPPLPSLTFGNKAIGQLASGTSPMGSPSMLTTVKERAMTPVPKVPAEAMPVQPTASEITANAPIPGGTPAAGGVDPAAFAAVLSSIKAPEAPVQPPLLQPGAAPTGIGGSINPELFQNLIKLMQGGNTGPKAIPTLGALIGR